MPDKSTIVLHRKESWTYRFSRYKVRIDGQTRGTISNGASERYALNPGRHSIQVRVGLYRSAPLEVELAADQELHLACGTRPGIAASLNAVTAPGNYLYLHEADTTPAGSREGLWSKVVALTDQISSGGAAQTEQKPGQAVAGSRAPVNLFISYRRGDSPDVCGRIYDRLVQEFGKAAVFKDVDSIPFGVDFRSHLDNQVGQCNVLLVVIGDRWLDDSGPDGRSRLFEARDFVRIEIESALKRDIPVVPLLVRGAELPDASLLPESIRPLVYRNGLPIRPDPDFHNDMKRLIEGLGKT